MKIGIVESLWRYPVKGMAGEHLDSVKVDSSGLKGDRIWAVQDIKRQELQSCKFRPQLLKCRARCLPDKLNNQVEITFPNGQVLRSESSQVDEYITELLGHDSQLKALKSVIDSDFYKRYKPNNHSWLEELKATFEREDGEPLPDLDNLPQVIQDYVSLPGTFFLVSPFHLLTTASLNYMKKLNPDADWQSERFRPNILIDTLPNLEGLIEQSWIGKQLKIGDITLDCSDLAPRCGAVVRAQSCFNEDKSILRSIVKHADQNLGIYGNIKQKGTIHVGDEVCLV